MQRLISLDGIISKLQKRSAYVPAGQQPIAQRCPPGSHAHGGMPYCHPEPRKHRAAGPELHQEADRVRAIDQKRKEIGEKMYQMAKRGKVVPEGIKRDYARLDHYIRRLTGERQLR